MPKIRDLNLVKLRIFIVYGLILTALLLFYHFTREVIEKETLDFDVWINSQIIQFRNPTLTNLMILVSDAGEIGGLIVVGFLALFLWLKKHFNRSINLLAIVSCAGFLTWVLKNLVSRNRPDIAFRLVNEAGFSYPSGHSTMAFTIYLVIAIYIFKYTKMPLALRNSFIGILVMFPFAVAFSRLYLGVHYFTDVAAGAIIGLSLSCVYYFLSRGKRTIRQMPRFN